MSDALQNAKFAQVLGVENVRSQDKENEEVIKSALNHLLKKPGFLAGFTKHVMEEIGTNPTTKNKKYVYNVIASYLDELIDLAV